MRATVACLLLVLVVTINGLDENIIRKQFRARHADKSHQSNKKSKQHVKTVSTAGVTEAPILVIKPELSVMPAARILDWFYPGQGFANLALGPGCSELAFCMMNAAEWGSNVQAWVPRNPYPLDWDDLKDAIKEAVERGLANGGINDDMKQDVANNFKMVAEECKYEDTSPGMCTARDCSRVFGYPAMDAPMGDAKYTGWGWSCNHNRECRPDALCIAFGGNPICQDSGRNTCHCMWILDKDSSSDMCGKTVDQLDQLGCADRCGDNVYVPLKTADNA